MTAKTQTFADSWMMELARRSGSRATPDVRVVWRRATLVLALMRKGRELTPWLVPAALMSPTWATLLLRPRGMLMLWGGGDQVGEAALTRTARTAALGKRPQPTEKMRAM